MCIHTIYLFASLSDISESGCDALYAIALKERLSIRVVQCDITDMIVCSKLLAIVSDEHLAATGRTTPSLHHPHPSLHLPYPAHFELNPPVTSKG